MYTRVYTGQPVTVFATQQFDDWMGRLKDAQGKSRIAARIRRISLGNMGDIKSVGGGVSELRIHTGPGYRVYFDPAWPGGGDPARGRRQKQPK